MKKIIFTFIFIAVSAWGIDLSSIVSNDNNATVNINSDASNVYGSHLFNGNFAKISQHIYNPDYRLAIGDVISLKLWGAFDYMQELTIDSQGNIFVPKVGSIHLLGIRNGDLVSIITTEIKRIYRDNVYVYADMGAYQNVSVFVTGNVNKPGLYQGLSSDSVIQYIDKASGINAISGSFRKITVLRDNKPYRSIDLYDFMLNGKMEMFAFRTGDVILVDNLGAYVNVQGEVLRPKKFEMTSPIFKLSEIAYISGIKPTTTNAIVTSYTVDNQMYVNSYPRSKFENVTLKSGDSVEFVPDYTSKMVQINIEGEHQGLHSLIVPKGTTLTSLKNMLAFSPQSDIESIQIYRKSVAAIQKKLIDAQLKELETIALTTPSVSAQEASLRTQEAQSILQFIDRAKNIEPKGQIVVSDLNAMDSIVLEEGDTINIPTKNNIVIVQGEVALPGAFTYEKNKEVNDYISMAGDMNERANNERILVIQMNGKAEKYNGSFLAFNAKPAIKEGDAILVLPKAEGKTLQVTSVISQILYQIAIASKVVLNL
ncbi:MAG: polysaccharide biosynthesis/export family protein [Sulfuricurvum sp.]